MDQPQQQQQQQTHDHIILASLPSSVMKTGQQLEQQKDHMTVVPSSFSRFSYWLWPKPQPARHHEMESIRERRYRMTTVSSSSSFSGDRPEGNGHPSPDPDPGSGSGEPRPPRLFSEGKKRGNSSPSRPSGKRTLCRFGYDHVQMSEWTQDLILDNRDLVGIDQEWAIHVEVQDPDTIYQHAEGLVSYDEEANYALITVRCDLPSDLLEWIVIHELFELKRYESASAIQDWYHFELKEYDGEPVRQQQEKRFYRAWQKARNREIEKEVYQYLGHRRPMHMPVSPDQPGTLPLPSVLHSSPGETTNSEKDDGDEDEEQNE